MPELALPHLPYYSLVPTDRRENLKWRLKVCRRAMVDAEFRADVLQMCKDDPIFWVQLFCFVYEPRANKNSKYKARVLPFILWPHQVRVAQEILACWGGRDVLIEKSRAEGASWLTLMLGLHSWLFDPLFTMGPISKDADSVDKRGDMSAQMPKLDWQLGRLPSWMRPQGFKPLRHRTDFKLMNPDNGSIITGYAATGDAASGGRTTVFMMDELAKFPKGSDYEVLDSTQAVTDCRVFVSTPKGDVGAFFDKAHDGETVKVLLDWKENPTKNAGLYRVDEGQIVELSPIEPAYREQLHDIHRRLEEKGFRIEKTVRSEWYNTQCLRSNPLSVAQEIDHNYGKSAEKAFEKDTIDVLIARQCRPALQTGRVKVQDDLSVIWQAINGGLVKIWCPLGGPDQRPPRRSYGAGGDVALGTGGAYSSNSTLFVGDLATGEQMLSFASSAIRVPEFARLAVAICRWFHDATLNWDSNGGPGTLFGQEVMDRWQYFNVIYSATQETGFNRTPGKKPGTHNHTDEQKSIYLSDCIEDALADRLIIRCEATLKEFSEFGFKGGKLVHLRAERTQSEAAKGKAHGDRATGAAMFNIVRREMGATLEATPERPPGPNDPMREVPWGCPANRYLAHHQAKQPAIIWK